MSRRPPNKPSRRRAAVRPPRDRRCDGSDASTQQALTLGQVEPIEIQQEMERSYLDYSMSVITQRALPDAKDGLKPVHRRILHTMLEDGLRPDRAHVKSAEVVGHVIARYHPHSLDAVYDALVRMGQDFSLRYPLIDGHGNFGSPDDPPAAYRYTECRLAPLALELLAGIEEDTVDFIDNYAGNRKQPSVLPARFPNLLVNGSEGIAVGMATKIPTHNLGEVDRRGDPRPRSPERDAEGPDEVRQGPGLPHGRDHPRPGRHPGRVSDGTRLDQDPGQGRDRRGQARAGDRRHRDPVPDESRLDRWPHRGSRQLQTGRRDPQRGGSESLKAARDWSSSSRGMPTPTSS